MQLTERISRAWQAFQGRSLTTGCQVGVPTGFERYNGRAGDYIRFAEEGYQLNAVVFACFWRIMQGCSIIPLKLALDGKAFEDDKIPEHLKPLVKLSHRPNPQTGYRSFVQTWVLHVGLGGNGYGEIIGAGTEKVGSRVRTLSNPELWLIRPSQMRLNRKGIHAREPQSYTDTARQLNFQPEQIIHWRLPNPSDNLLGLPLLEAAAVLIDSSNYAFEWNASLFKNSAVPAGILFLKELAGLTDKERDKIIRDFKRDFAGVKNAGQTYVTAAETADYKQLGQSAKDLDWSSGQASLMRFICAVMGVPSKLLNDPEAGTYANYEAARSSFFLETIVPWMEFFADELTHKLLPAYGEGLSFILDTKRVNELILDVAGIRKSLKDAEGYMTPDDQRAQDPAELQPLGGDAGKLRPQPMTLAEAVRGGVQKSEGRDLPRLERRSEILPYVATGSLYQTLQERKDAGDDFDKRRGKWEGKYERTIRGYFDWQLEEVLKADWETNSPHRILDSVGSLDQFIARFETLSLELTVDFGQAALDELKLKGFNFDIDRPGLKGRIASDLADRSKLIDRTSANRIRDVLEQAAAEGAQEQARRIRELYSDFSHARANTIARTETGRAGTQASLEGYKQSGVVKFKEWLSARDDNVRESHETADGQVVPLDGFFSVGGKQTAGPGLSGDPGEDIDCRCRVAPLREASQAI